MPVLPVAKTKLLASTGCGKK